MGCFDRQCAQSKIPGASSDMSSGSSCDESLLLAFPPLKPRVDSCSTCQDGDVFQTSHDSVVTILIQYLENIRFQVIHLSASSPYQSTCPVLLCTHCDASLLLPFPPFILKMEGPDCRSCQHGRKAKRCSSLATSLAPPIRETTLDFQRMQQVRTHTC